MRRRTRWLTVARATTSLAAVATVALAACGDDSTGSPGPTDSVSDVSLVPASPPTTGAAVDVPSVEVPAQIPTELVVTEITPGEGEPAVAGDLVFVDYVGVRTEDGTQFDTSFGREPLPVVLGRGSVIPGWDEGLLGAETGERLQLDVPAELAYGDDPPPGGSIQPGDALSFLIDVLAVAPQGTPPAEADLPVSDQPVTEPVIDDVRPGDGDALAEGQVAFVQLVAARADNGVILQSTWDAGTPQKVAVVRGQMLDGLVAGLPGMHVGGRRIVTIPFEDAFGADGRPSMGLPGETDVIVVVDLLYAY